ncbi:MAG: hypothetical protein RSE12_14505 [Fuscovulum sp.]|nr:MAG: hypothetical protein RSE12_14505 [Fuscovulum sp.]
MSAYRTPKTLAALKMVERMAEKLEGRMKPGSPAHSTYVTAHRLAASVDNLEELARTRSPSETPEAHAMRVAAAARKLTGNMAEVQAKLNQNLNQKAGEFTARISAATGLGQETPHAPEIRAYFRSLSPQDRTTHLAQAIKDRDTTTLAAIMSGPEYLAGLDKQMKDRFLDMYQREVAPELVADWETYVEADQDAQHVLAVARQAAEQAFDPAHVAEILSKDAEAKAAGEKLEASMGELMTPPAAA